MRLTLASAEGRAAWQSGVSYWFTLRSAGSAARRPADLGHIYRCPLDPFRSETSTAVGLYVPPSASVKFKERGLTRIMAVTNGARDLMLHPRDLSLTLEDVSKTA